jgi:hypothetical protein
MNGQRENAVTVEALFTQIMKYTSSHHRDNMPTYAISGLYDLFPESGASGKKLVTHRWPDEWPNHSSAGIYAVFDDKIDLIYLGKTPQNSFLEARLDSCFGSRTERSCRLIGEWRIQPRYVLTVAVADDSTWEAAAMEEFLINTLSPALNERGQSSARLS